MSAKSRLKSLVRRGRATVEPAPDWSRPPQRTPAQPVRAAVVVGDWLAEGLAAEWHQTRVSDGRVPADAELVLVEVRDGRIGGGAAHTDEPPAPQAPSGVPLVVWATGGRPWPEVLPLVRSAAAVFVAEAADLDAWKAEVPTARLLAPAASTRVAPAGPGARERRADLVAQGPIGHQVAGQVASVVGAWVKSAEGTPVVTRRVDARAALPRPLIAAGEQSDVAQALGALGTGSVLVDGLRRTPGDTWAVLAAAARGTSVLGLDGASMPEGLEVPLLGSTRDLRAEVLARLEQAELRDREGLLLRRALMASEHGFDRRVETIRAAAGLPAGPPVRGPRTVSAVVPTRREHELDNVFANLGRQRGVSVELILVLHGLSLDAGELTARAAEHGVDDLVVIEADPTLTLGACMNLGVDAAQGAYVAKMDDDNFYGAHYLNDLLDGFTGSGAGIVGKWAHYVLLQSSGAVVLRYPDAENAYQRRIQGGSMVFERDVVQTLRFGDLPRAVDSDILDRAMAEGVRIWSGDRFNFVSVRGVDRSAHTWTVPDAAFLSKTGRLAFYGDPRTHVEV